MGASAKTWHNISECLSVLRFLAVLLYCILPVMVFFSSSAGLDRCLVSDVLLSPPPPTLPSSPSSLRHVSVEQEQHRLLCNSVPLLGQQDKVSVRGACFARHALS